MCFPSGRCPKTENPTHHLPRTVFSFCQHSRLLTFHITELGHFCGHLPSKPDGFFQPPRPHAAIIHRIQPGKGRNVASSPSISPSRANFVIIYPQKSACFSRGSAPFFTIVSEKSNWSRSEVLPSHLPYHRLGPLLPPFTLKNQAVFREGRSPTDIDRSYPHAGYIHIKKAFGPKKHKNTS